MARWDPSDPGGHFEGEPEERIAELEQERTRLAAELLASQAREAGLRGAIEDALPRIMTVWSNDQEWEVGFDGSRAEAELTAALASPSPAAEAIGRVVEASQEETDAEREKERVQAMAETADLDWGRLPLARDARRDAVDALQALRSGQASRGERNNERLERSP